jgi:hypothetical protein
MRLGAGATSQGNGGAAAACFGDGIERGEDRLGR